MIGNQAALRPEYAPRDLYHREGQLEVLRRCLTPLSADLTAENVGIYGPIGSGKTTIARYALEQVDHELTTGQWSYVNCFSTPSTTAVLRAATADAGLEVPIDPAGTTAQTYIERLRDAEEPIVIVLDEAGALPDLMLLGTFYELPTTSFVAVDEATWSSSSGSSRSGRSSFASGLSVLHGRPTSRTIRDAPMLPATLRLRAAHYLKDPSHSHEWLYGQP